MNYIYILYTFFVLKSIITKTQKLLYTKQIMQLSDVQHLATLARLEINEDEQKALLGDLTAILGYIEQIQTADVSLDVDMNPEQRNVVREDVVTNTPGSFTEIVMKEVPSAVDGFVKVKKIL